MPRLEFFVVAESVVVDQVTNEASVFNIYEEIRSEGFPLLIHKCAAISLWLSEPGDEDKDCQAVLRIILPGEEAKDFPTNFKFTAETRRHRVTQRIYGLPVSREGDLRFELLLNGRHAAEHLVTIRKVASVDIPGQGLKGG